MITVIGAGSWGTTLARLLANNKNDVKLWVREKELFDILKKQRENTWFNKGFKLPENLKFVNEYKDVKGSRYIINAIPCQYVRETLSKFAPYISKDAIIINVSKGIEQGTCKRISTIIEEVLPERTVAVLSGPNHAEEVIRGLPTATVIACEDPHHLPELIKLFETDNFKVYGHDDVIGVEICAAFKNITAIATGVVAGLGFGDNALGAIMTYGLTEMNSFGRYFGAQKKTIYGLAGVGDLIATCSSKHSRNRFVGQKICEGKSYEDIQKEMGGMVAEGVHTAKAVHEFAAKNGLDLPLTEQTYQVLFENKDLKEAISDLKKLI
ncbi:MAG: NAD(P)-dependent glycerol-3-phosphate dehydrogenase [Nanoarchaeota archaeon]|nr:NAD(P)-dependent glycerol-3-phosphate dehydrogenase [Nanoarchaeota archaeon]MBU1704849.1 NAD(P)-dependent glycerol-3-phosphate dehydrogenase [Nanoarchaeota archaeon]